MLGKSARFADAMSFLLEIPNELADGGEALWITLSPARDKTGIFCCGERDRGIFRNFASNPRPARGKAIRSGRARRTL
jgi:hypothetical protein